MKVYTANGYEFMEVPELLWTCATFKEAVEVCDKCIKETPEKYYGFMINEMELNTSLFKAYLYAQFDEDLQKIKVLI